VEHENWIDELKGFGESIRNPAEARRFRHLIGRIESSRDRADLALRIGLSSSRPKSVLGPVQEFLSHG
jgi:hypothetical protein